MEQPTPHKRKPGRPRKTKPDAGTPNTQTPESNPSENPLEATIKAARSAYEPSNQSRSPIVPQGTDKGEVTAKGDDRLGMGAVTLAPLPSPRAHGKLVNVHQYASSFSNEQVEMWATAWIATGKRQQWLIEACPQIGRENNRFRADLVRELESHPVAQETVIRLKEEQVMSDLQRRTKLRKIAESEEHGLRGYADHIKAIELDAKLDPESNIGKRTESQSQVFNAPVSLFFIPSTQAAKIATATESQPILEVPSLTLPTSSPLPPVGGTPGT